MRVKTERPSTKQWLDLSLVYQELSDQHLCRDMCNGSMFARQEFLSRVNKAELEGDYLFANYLYKMLLEQVFYKKVSQSNK